MRGFYCDGGWLVSVAVKPGQENEGRPVKDVRNIKRDGVVCL